MECSWSGIVASAAEDENDLAMMAPVNSQDLRSIEDGLNRGECPEELAGHVRNLLDTVRRLQALLELARRAQRRPRTVSSELNDTIVF
jgi:hypothetical protein